MMVGPTLADVPDLWLADSRESGNPDLSGDVSQLCFSGDERHFWYCAVRLQQRFARPVRMGSRNALPWVRAMPFHVTINRMIVSFVSLSHGQS